MNLSEFLKKIKILKGRMPVSGLLPYPGEHFSPRKTQESEIADRRPYFDGDDIRYIDWKQFARSDRYYVKLALTPSKGKCTFILDNSPSMFIPPEKYINSCLFLLCLIYTSIQEGDRVDIGLLKQNKVERINNNALFYQIYNNWLNQSPATNPAIKEIPLFTDFENILQFIPRKSFLVFISDLYIRLVDLENLLLNLHKKNINTYFIHSLTTKERLGPEHSGWKKFQDFETGTHYPISTEEAKAIPSRLHQAINSRKKMILNLGFDYFFFNTELSPFSEVMKVYGNN
jgi:uncharacterized protein (DUF58 family)